MSVFVPLDRVEPLALQVEVAGQGGVAVTKPKTRNRQISQTDAFNTWKWNRKKHLNFYAEIIEDFGLCDKIRF